MDCLILDSIHFKGKKISACMTARSMKRMMTSKVFQVPSVMTDESSPLDQFVSWTWLRMMTGRHFTGISLRPISLTWIFRHHNN